MKKEIRELSIIDLQEWLSSIKEPVYRAKQIYEWLWAKHVSSFDEMSNLSIGLRNQLKEQFAFHPITIDHTQQSVDGTIKYRFKTYDGHFIEGVLIPTTQRVTACISSQVGCSLTCKFCATGKMERKRNLFFYEIFDQVALINKDCQKLHNKKLSNVVYMGMGEPLLNYRNVGRSIQHLTAADGMAMSPSRITVSTSGIVKQIREMADDKWKVNLAISLHAADNIKRSRLMPINDTHSIEDLVEALDYYFKKTKLAITYEYILFKGINDGEEDAKNLIKLSRRIPSKVNLIEYNSIEGAKYEKSDAQHLDKFVINLEKNNVTVIVRRSRGKDISAACGQLANI